jgi:hypothetical protein
MVGTLTLYWERSLAVMGGISPNFHPKFYLWTKCRCAVGSVVWGGKIGKGPLWRLASCLLRYGGASFDLLRARAKCALKFCLGDGQGGHPPSLTKLAFLSKYLIQVNDGPTLSSDK